MSEDTRGRGEEGRDERGEPRGSERHVYGIQFGDGSGKVFWGVGMVALGVAFLLDQQDMLPRGFWHLWWPGYVIAMGAIFLVTARSASALGNGVMLVLMGGWFMAAQQGWYGLNWGNSWPLSLIAVGAGMVVRAIAMRWLPDRSPREGRRHA